MFVVNGVTFVETGADSAVGKLMRMRGSEERGRGRVGGGRKERN